MSTVLPAAAYAEGAPPGFSGGFSEQSCHACHFHAEVNSGQGRVAIAGVPERFVAGTRYPLTITLARSGMALGGFQLTARFTDGGAQAGVLAPAPGEEERIRVDVQGDVQYVGQRRQGTALPAPDTARWAVVWTAPETSAPVTFHVAANAADGDGSVEGDYIHSAAAQSAPPGH
ncbi:MAG TPA: choice-of-anchor V domain-containing protein [Vicinamibacterales bacterium]|nr:choice-of-anchor V domain-containing protein [Vicinamibacterales bacterium]